MTLLFTQGNTFGLLLPIVPSRLGSVSGEMFPGLLSEPQEQWLYEGGVGSGAPGQVCSAVAGGVIRV